METPSQVYTQRTQWNVRDSDATLILVSGELAGGTLKTVVWARHLGKPHLIERLGRETKETKAWLSRLQPETLNVAGPRESGAPGIYEEARVFLRRLFSF